MRRAYLDPTNTAGRWCGRTRTRRRARVRHVRPRRPTRNLRDIAALSKRKRVASLRRRTSSPSATTRSCIEVMLRDRMVDAAVAIEPEPLVPGAGWSQRPLRATRGTGRRSCDARATRGRS